MAVAIQQSKRSGGEVAVSRVAHRDPVDLSYGGRFPCGDTIPCMCWVGSHVWLFDEFSNLFIIDPARRHEQHPATSSLGQEFDVDDDFDRQSEASRVSRGVSRGAVDGSVVDRLRADSVFPQTTSSKQMALNVDYRTKFVSTARHTDPATSSAKKSSPSGKVSTGGSGSSSGSRPHDISRTAGSWTSVGGSCAFSILCCTSALSDSTVWAGTTCGRLLIIDTASSGSTANAMSTRQQKPKCIRQLKKHVGAVTCVAYDASTLHVISGSEDFRIIIWCAESQSYIRAIHGGHSLHVTALCVRDGLCVSGAADGVVMAWWVPRDAAPELLASTDETISVPASAADEQEEESVMSPSPKRSGSFGVGTGSVSPPPTAPPTASVGANNRMFFQNMVSAGRTESVASAATGVGGTTTTTATSKRHRNKQQEELMLLLGGVAEIQLAPLSDQELVVVRHTSNVVRWFYVTPTRLVLSHEYTVPAPMPSGEQQYGASDQPETRYQPSQQPAHLAINSSSGRRENSQKRLNLRQQQPPQHGHMHLSCISGMCVFPHETMILLKDGTAHIHSNFSAGAVRIDNSGASAAHQAHVGSTGGKQLPPKLAGFRVTGTPMVHRLYQMFAVDAATLTTVEWTAACGEQAEAKMFVDAAESGSSNTRHSSGGSGLVAKPFPRLSALGRASVGERAKMDVMSQALEGERAKRARAVGEVKRLIEAVADIKQRMILAASTTTTAAESKKKAVQSTAADVAPLAAPPVTLEGVFREVAAADRIMQAVLFDTHKHKHNQQHQQNSPPTKATGTHGAPVAEEEEDEDPAHSGSCEMSRLERIFAAALKTIPPVNVSESMQMKLHTTRFFGRPIVPSAGGGPASDVVGGADDDEYGVPLPSTNAFEYFNLCNGQDDDDDDDNIGTEARRNPFVRCVCQREGCHGGGGRSRSPHREQSPSSADKQKEHDEAVAVEKAKKAEAEEAHQRKEEALFLEGTRTEWESKGIPLLEKLLKIADSSKPEEEQKKDLPDDASAASVAALEAAAAYIATLEAALASSHQRIRRSATPTASVEKASTS